MSDHEHGKLPIKGVGIWHVTDNETPNSSTIIGYSRDSAIDDTMASLRISAASPSSDNLNPANIQALDTNSFLHGWDSTGSNWDRITLTSGALNVNIANSSPIGVDVNGVYSVGNTDPDNVGLISHVRAVSPTDADQTLRLTGKNGTVQTDVWALDVSLHDHNGNNYTLLNPMPVQNIESPGDEINVFDEGTSLAGSGTTSHLYTVTAAKTLYLNKIWGSSAGRAKWTVGIETGVGTGIYNTRFVAYNSVGTPNIEIDIRNPILVAAGVRVRVLKLNRENQPTDVTSTIEGYEI